MQTLRPLSAGRLQRPALLPHYCRPHWAETKMEEWPHCTEAWVCMGLCCNPQLRVSAGHCPGAEGSLCSFPGQFPSLCHLLSLGGWVGGCCLSIADSRLWESPCVFQTRCQLPAVLAPLICILMVHLVPNEDRKKKIKKGKEKRAGRK